MVPVYGTIDQVVFEKMSFHTMGKRGRVYAVGLGNCVGLFDGGLSGERTSVPARGTISTT